ncbi:MAG: hypothetical protein HY433_00085 [Candidatus Liptonbacteria bacterium]|nr:hypothetical protein [Candidatus Liptonbacteria bacterium]
MSPEKIALLVILFPFIIAAIAWSLYWKGRALWKAARRNELMWFIAILVINTFGILEIVYIYWFTKEKKNVEMRQKQN